MKTDARFLPPPKDHSHLHALDSLRSERDHLRAENARLRAALADVVDSVDQWARAQGATSDPGLVVSVDWRAIETARAALDGAR